MGKHTPPVWIDYVAATRATAHALDVGFLGDVIPILEEAVRNGEIKSRGASSEQPKYGCELSPADWLLSDANGPVYGISSVEVHRTSLHKWLKQYQPTIISGAKRGPKTSYDWNKCWAYICRYVHENGLPEKPSEMQEAVRDWFVAQTDDHPGDTAVKDHVRLLYQEFGR